MRKEERSVKEKKSFQELMGTVGIVEGIQYVMYNDQKHRLLSVDYDGWCCLFNEEGKLSVEIMNDEISEYKGIQVKEMTKDECLGWAYNDGSKGWVVKNVTLGNNINKRHPCEFNYNMPRLLRRATIDTNGNIGDWQKFEKELRLI